MARHGELMDDVVHEILLRFPPSSYISLVRASAVCKSWRRVLHDPVFLRRYRELHRRQAPPQLGFLTYRQGLDGRGRAAIMRPITAVVEGDRLYLWAWRRSSDENLEWVLFRTIDLRKLLPAYASSLSPLTFGLARTVGTMFLATDAGAFVIELGSGKVRKVSVIEVFYATVTYIGVEPKDCFELSAGGGGAVQSDCCSCVIRFGEFCFDLNNNPPDAEEEVVGSSRVVAGMPQRKLVFEGANLRKKRQKEELKKPKMILIGSMPLEIN